MATPPRTAQMTPPPRRKRRRHCETAAPAPSVLSTPGGDIRFIVQSLEIEMKPFEVRAQYRRMSHYLDLPIDRAMRAMAEEVFPQARVTRVWASVASPVSEGTCMRWAPCGGGRRIYAHKLREDEDTAEEPLPALREVLTMAREGDREGCSRAVMFGCAECPIHGASFPAAVAADSSVDDPMLKSLFAIVGTELGGVDRLTALPSTVVRVELRDEDNATVATLTRGSRGSPHLERGEDAAPVRAVALLAPPAPERTRPRSPCRALFVRAFEAPILRSRIWSAHSVEDAVRTWRKFSKLGGSAAIRPPIIEFDLCQKRLREAAKRKPLNGDLLKHIASFIDAEAVLLGGLSARVESVFGLNKIQHRTIQFEQALIVDKVDDGKAGKPMRNKIQKVDTVIEFNFETDTLNPRSFDASTLANLEAPTIISRSSAFSARAIKT